MIRKFSSTIGALLFCALTSMSASYAQQMLVVHGGTLRDALATLDCGSTIFTPPLLVHSKP